MYECTVCKWSVGGTPTDHLQLAWFGSKEGEGRWIPSLHPYGLYYHRLTSKIQFEPEVLKLLGYPSFSLVELDDFTYNYVFEVEEFNGDTFNTLPLPVDLEYPVWTGNTGTLRLPIFFFGGIYWYYLYLCFRGREIQWWHFLDSITTGWPWKSRLNRKYWNFKVTDLSPWWNFMILPMFMFSRSRNSMVTLSELYHYRLT